MCDPLETIRALLAAIEAGDRTALRFYAPGIQQVEHPNALKPLGDRRTMSRMSEDFERGREILRSQRYDLRSAVVSGDQVVVQAVWTGELAVPYGRFQPGDKMCVQSAMFFRVRDGKIVAQENYDCVEPFAAA